MGRLLAISIVTLLVPAGLQGQQLTPTPSYAVSSVPAPVSFHVDSTHAYPHTYWLEGGVIGGVGMGVFTILLANGLGEGHTSLAGNAMAFVIGGSVGFPVGALIGGQFPKHPAGH